MSETEITHFVAIPESRAQASAILPSPPPQIISQLLPLSALYPQTMKIRTNIIHLLRNKE